MNLFDRARKALRGMAPAAAARPQYYNVACPEGHRLQGQRTEGYQAVRCPTCGEGIFVLPLSPLPEPPAPAGDSRRAARAVESASLDDAPLVLSDPPRHDLPEDEAAEVEIEWVDAPAGSAPIAEFDPSIVEVEPQAPVAPEPKPVRPAKVSAPAAPGPSARGGRRAVEIPPRPAPRPRVTWSEWAGKNRNTLIFGGAAAVVLLTAALLVRREQRRELPRFAELGRTEGIPALDAGEFDRAKELLVRAAAAVDSLGGAYEGADGIRQAAREVVLFTDLVPETLERILDEARSFDPIRWPEHFAALYRGRSILVDAAITSVPGEGGKEAFDLNYRIYAGSGANPSVRGRIDLAGFALFEGASFKPGDRVVFGGRLDSVQLGPEGDEWLVGLQPESGVMITHTKALQALGFYTADLDLDSEALP